MKRTRLRFDVAFSRVVAVVVSVACLVTIAVPMRAETAAASRGQEAGIQQPIAGVPSLAISGVVLRADRKTPAANVRLRLRNLDTGAIVGRTVSDASGAFSFAIPATGLYVVEAIDDDGAVLAVSDPAALSASPVTTNVVLPVQRSAWLPVLAAAAGAGIAAWSIGGRTAVSPEQ